jgi:hypothetical protein
MTHENLCECLTTHDCETDGERAGARVGVDSPWRRLAVSSYPQGYDVHAKLRGIVADDVFDQFKTIVKV